MTLEADLKSFEWIWTTHFDEFMLLENGSRTLIVRGGEKNYTFMVIEDDESYAAVKQKMRDAGIRIIDGDEFNRLRGRENRNPEVIEKEKRKRQPRRFPFLLLFLSLFLLCGVMCGFLFIYPDGCTWYVDERPQLIDPPPNSTLIRNRGITRILDTYSLTREYTVDNATLSDVVSYYENEHAAQCRVYTGSRYGTAYAHCFGTNPQLGEYTIYNENQYDNRRQQNLNYSIIWRKCELGWRFQDS
jgi:hypothetical protein